jgi:hypothetical protein
MSWLEHFDAYVQFQGSRIMDYRTAATLTFTTIALLAGGAAHAQTAWPSVALPEGIETFSIGEQVSANGRPVRMRGFVSSTAPARMVQLFKASLGQPLVEDISAAKTVLGRAQGEFYVTVQLETAGAGSRGVIALTRLRSMLADRDASKQADQRLLSRLPASTRLVSRTASVDGWNHAQHLVFTNALSPELNTSAVARMLGADGFALEREAPAASSGKTLFFRRSDGEALAVIFRDPSGSSLIVLNTIRFSGAAK